MGRSFKFRVFLLILTATLGIVLSNRLIAQYFLTEQLQEQIHVDMGRALEACTDKSTDKLAFLTCSKLLDQGSILSNASDYYVLCQGGASTCPGVFGAESSSFRMEQANANIKYWRGRLNDEEWMAVRQSSQVSGLQVWIKRSDADLIRQKLWALRDQNLWRVAPIVFLFLLVLSWVAVKIIMRPIKTIEQSIATLNANNLGQDVQLNAPFQEFESLVSVYKSLLLRLNESFNNAHRFASDASHELRTPLTILRGNTEQLIRDLPTGSDQQVRVRNLGDEVERLIDITEKLLLLSRADANSLGRTFSIENLSDMVEQLIAQEQDLEQDLEQGQDLPPPPFALTSSIEPRVLWCCDKTLAKLLIHNLFENAQKYNFNQGWIHVSLQREGEQFRLSIENSSANLAADLEVHAFDRFYRGDASHGRHIDGLGLGLSICAEIAKVHQASLSLRVTEKKSVVVSLVGPLSIVH